LHETRARQLATVPGISFFCWILISFKFFFYFEFIYLFIYLIFIYLFIHSFIHVIFYSGGRERLLNRITATDCKVMGWQKIRLTFRTTHERMLVCRVLFCRPRTSACTFVTCTYSFTLANSFTDFF
jgi:hypothetical protein